MRLAHRECRRADEQTNARNNAYAKHEHIRPRNTSFGIVGNTNCVVGDFTSRGRAREPSKRKQACKAPRARNDSRKQSSTPAVTHAITQPSA
eukprot:1667972-Lingulodinium_polyedra.AAC.1